LYAFSAVTAPVVAARISNGDLSMRRSVAGIIIAGGAFRDFIVYAHSCVNVDVDTATAAPADLELHTKVNGGPFPDATTQHWIYADCTSWTWSATHHCDADGMNAGDILYIRLASGAGVSGASVTVTINDCISGAAIEQAPKMVNSNSNNHNNNKYGGRSYESAPKEAPKEYNVVDVVVTDTAEQFGFGLEINPMLVISFFSGVAIAAVGMAMAAALGYYCYAFRNKTKNKPNAYAPVMTPGTESTLPTHQQQAV
jgi:hypothetical protein